MVVIYQNVLIATYIDISTEIVLNLDEMTLRKGREKVRDNKCRFYATVLEKSRGFYTTHFHNDNFLYQRGYSPDVCYN